jgi:hypothetical protein
MLFSIQTRTVWITEEGTGGAWEEGNLTYSTPFPHIFILEATPILGKQDAFRGYVAVDNTQLSEGRHLNKEGEKTHRHSVLDDLDPIGSGTFWSPDPVPHF